MALLPPFGFPSVPSHPPVIPMNPTSSYFVDCLYQYTFVRLWNGESFWFYPTAAEYSEVSGYRWNGRFWFQFVVDPRHVRFVSCRPVPTLY
ncbi:transporter [Paenibacillus mucilaginosus]|nr:transporter [Paenibacillus mucilaginosus]